MEFLSDHLAAIVLMGSTVGFFWLIWSHDAKSSTASGFHPGDQRIVDMLRSGGSANDTSKAMMSGWRAKW
jgi:hypothetical protein